MYQFDPLGRRYRRERETGKWHGRITAAYWDGESERWVSGLTGSTGWLYRRVP